MSISFRKTLSIWMVVASCSFFISCSSTPERGKVAKEWSLAMRELQINPVFPPREDFYVGDVYVLPTTPDRLNKYMENRDEYIPIGSRAGYIDLTDEVVAEYKHRPSFPQTTEAKLAELKSILQENGIETAKQKEIIEAFIKSWLEDDVNIAGDDDDDDDDDDNDESDDGESDDGESDDGESDDGESDDGESDNAETDNAETDNAETDKTDSNNPETIKVNTDIIIQTQENKQYTLIIDKLDEEEVNVVYPIVRGKPYILKIDLSEKLEKDGWELTVSYDNEILSNNILRISSDCKIDTGVEKDGINKDLNTIALQAKVVKKKEDTQKNTEKKEDLNKLIDKLKSSNSQPDQNNKQSEKYSLGQIIKLFFEILKLVESIINTEITIIRTLKIEVYEPIYIYGLEDKDPEVNTKFSMSIKCKHTSKKKVKWEFYDEKNKKLPSWNGLTFGEDGKIEGTPKVAKAIKITPKVYYEGTKNCEFVAKEFWICVKPVLKTPTALHMSRIGEYYYTRLELTENEGYEITWTFHTHDDKDLKQWNGLTFNSEGEILGIPLIKDFLSFKATASLKYGGRVTKIPSEFYILVGDTVYTNRDLTRLREVSFPSFMSTTFTYSQLGGLIPIEAVGLIFGTKSQSKYYVSVNIPSAESYGVSNLTVIKDYVDKKNPKSIEKLKHLYKLVPKEQTDYLPKYVCYVDIITEVYYARAIDISITSDNAVKLENALGITDSDKNSKVDYVELTKLLNEKMQIPGSKLKFGSVSQYSVSMRRVFNRPIAIGYRGLRLTVKCTDEGEVYIEGAVPIKGNNGLHIKSFPQSQTTN